MAQQKRKKPASPKSNQKRSSATIAYFNPANRQKAIKTTRRKLEALLSSKPWDAEKSRQFTARAIEFATFSFISGQGYQESSKYLTLASESIEKFGDRRSKAIMDLHLGRFYYFAGLRIEAMKFFENGKKVVEDLGDEDILNQASVIIGLHYMAKGLIKEALPFFERATQSFENDFLNDRLVDPSTPVWLGVCQLYLGQFNLAIGTIDYYRRLALEHSDQSMSALLQATLGLMLAMTKNKKDALHHLNIALVNSLNTNNALAGLTAKLGVSVVKYFDGDFQGAYDSFSSFHSDAHSFEILTQYIMPIFLEILFDFTEQGFPPIDDELSYDYLIEKVMDEQNIYMRGVALRLKAVKAFRTNQSDDRVESYLLSSEEHLNKTGERFYLSKTHIEMARLKLRQDNIEEAKHLAEMSFNDLSDYTDRFFPDDLLYLVHQDMDDPKKRDHYNKVIEIFASMIEDLAPKSEPKDSLNHLVAATNRFFSAERAGLFWFESKDRRKKPELIAAFNLTSSDVQSKEFKSGMKLIRKVCNKRNPAIVRHDDERDSNYIIPKAMLCIPFQSEKRILGVLYLDNSTSKDCFELFDKPQLLKITSALLNYESNIQALIQRMDQKAAFNFQGAGIDTDSHMVAQSETMINVFSVVDKVAETDGNVLILGETGVGKELIAKRLHLKSHRRNAVLITVDPTTIPENLVESELFGHEKGAFTGADRQKIGRIELANGGTLFLDEIGEIHPSIQVKLLRVLQEKSLMRLGGSSYIQSDFRLVAATNKDLSKEVVEGNFREDLFYRINVVPLNIPPLRERKEDILLLADHFLKRYAKKYNRKLSGLKPDDQTLLEQYPWPGNVRELKNIIERAVILSNDNFLNLSLPAETLQSYEEPLSEDMPTLDELQRRYIQKVLDKTGGRISGTKGAAAILGLKRTTLNARIKKFGIR